MRQHCLSRKVVDCFCQVPHTAYRRDIRVFRARLWGANGNSKTHLRNWPRSCQFALRARERNRANTHTHTHTRTRVHTCTHLVIDFRETIVRTDFCSQLVLAGLSSSNSLSRRWSVQISPGDSLCVLATSRREPREGLSSAYRASDRVGRIAVISPITSRHKSPSSRGIGVSCFRCLLAVN